MDPSNEPDYPFIVAWGRYMGSNPEYVQSEIERARLGNHPNTIYAFGPKGRAWDISTLPAEIRHYLQRRIKD